MKAPVKLETDRLILRLPTASDATAIFHRYASDPDVTRYMSWRRHRSLDDTHAFLSFSEEEWTRWPAGPYVVTSREDGEVIGGTGLTFETPSRAMTGHVLARDAWGRGYATEALIAIASVAARLGVVRLFALCHTAHRASYRVLEKCGFEREGVLRRYMEFPNLAPCSLADVYCYARIFAADGVEGGANSPGT